MAQKTIRVGLIGAGANTRTRHIPGLRAIDNVDIIAICNRRPESTAAVAREFGVPRTFERWQDLVAAPDVDAIVIGTWPYMHCPITLAAFESGKHVLTEARLSMNAAEAHRMLEASRRHPELVAQVVPSPFGLKGDTVMRELLDQGFVGDLLEYSVVSRNDALADPAAPLAWRQDAALSGYNTLTLGIIHETVLRWLPPPIRVMAQVHAFIPTRIDPASGVRRPVGTPDSVQVLTVLHSGARGIYQVSGVARHGQAMMISLFGTKGQVHYDLIANRIHGTATSQTGPTSAKGDLPEIPIPREKMRDWQVEADFIDAVRGGQPIRLTDFATGVSYMEFTEAVARSAEEFRAVELPLEEFAENER
jgi:predicted dehydrogenase